MEIYLVGGAVRDRLLGRPVHERDWVVVGARPEDMLARGFRMVGRGFPVFLHPESAEEYALARTERKDGHGHRGFTILSDPGVRLEDDLRRRDLTINAMAEDENGRLVDPHGGRADLESRMLRHVSEAFVEDPLRVLRVARFRAELAPWKFRIAPETQTLLRAMNTSGELATLTPERVGRETLRALAAPQPSLFFTTLAEIGALGTLFPELAALVGITQEPRLHGGLDAWTHTLRVLDAAAAEELPVPLVYALLVHDLGKGVPGHGEHDQRGAEPVRRLTARLALGNDFRDLGLLAARAHLDAHRILVLPSRLLLVRLEAADLLRRRERAAALATVARIDWHTRPGWEEKPYPQGPYLIGLVEELANLRLPDTLRGSPPATIHTWFAHERRRRILLHRRRLPLRERVEARTVRHLYPLPQD
jgi:tRNA nucleotidyltransferase (CCA-adding enzyme)